MKRADIHKLDRQWATIVKDKAGWKCEFCEVEGVRMEAAHVAGRRYRATRWGSYRFDPERIAKLRFAVVDNTYDLCGHCLCHNCHQQYDDHGPLEPRIVEKTVGVDRKERIQQLASVPKAAYQDYDDIKEILEGFMVTDRLNKEV